jgi:alkyl hydroperoxide reductase subunit D
MHRPFASIQTEGTTMNLEALMETVPTYAKDLKLNFSSVTSQTELTEQQIWGTAVASAVASRNAEIILAILEEATKHVSAQVIDAAKGAAAVMGMNNIYYRFHHLSTNEKYSTLPARLRMNIIRTHGVDAADFELWCVAVSAINACGKCVDAHEHVLREKGVTEETINAAIRIASVIHGLAVVFDTERVSAGQTVNA